MKTCLDCIPCFFRQALESCRLAGAGKRAQRKVLESVGALLPKMSLTASPPEIAREVYRSVGRMVNGRDPYRAIKRESNAFALRLYKELKKDVARSRDPLRTAVETAIRGNIIDFGSKSSLEVEKEKKKLRESKHRRIRSGQRGVFHFTEFTKALRRSRTILYLADNAGETVFDRVLIEEIKRCDPGKEIFYAVKESPAINDALEEDAIVCGLDLSARVLSSGCDAPGTVLRLCRPGFRKLFRSAGMVISKGQGNYESLSGAKRGVFFLFMIKCVFVAKDVGGRVGDAVLLRGGGEKS